MSNQEAIGRQLAEVQDLYAQLFLLMVQSIAEDPLEEATGGIDSAIEMLMVSIDSHMSELRETLAAEQAAGGPDETMRHAAEDFESRLREGLSLMAERVRRRTGELTATREQLKDRLRMVQLKGKGARGYRQPVIGNGLIQSRA